MTDNNLIQSNQKNSDAIKLDAETTSNTSSSSHLPNVLLCLTGSVAALKAEELVTELQKIAQVKT